MQSTKLTINDYILKIPVVIILIKLYLICMMNQPTAAVNSFAA